MSVFFAVCLLLAEIFCGSWNLEWFPSGRAEHRGSPRLEAANIADAAELVREGLKDKAHAILFFQELRDASACSNLVFAIGLTNFHVAVASEWRSLRDNRLEWQQCAIVTDLPVIESHWRYFDPLKSTVPRGWVYALLDGGEDGLIACYGIHLKSNYGSSKPKTREANKHKRELSANILVREIVDSASIGGRKIVKALIGGDFNADKFDSRFANEKTFAIFENAGFINIWDSQPLEKRGTFPGKGKWPDSTLDYFLYRGFTQAKPLPLSKKIPLSDHRMIWASLR